MELKIENLSFSYPGKDVLTDVSFSAREGEVIGIMGQNGCGKTTLLKCVNGSNKATSGNVILNGIDISSLSRKEIAQKMAFVMQTTSMTFPFTVYETVMMGRYSHMGFATNESNEDVDVVYQAMKDTGTLDFKDRRINELSGGERRRVFIARALAQKPEILILDEPTLHLDIKYQFELLELIQGLAREKGILVLIVTHDLILASRYCDKMLLIKDGGISNIGETSEVATTENYRKIFEVLTEIKEDFRFGLDVLLVGKI